jgi:probable rRNA maturation factor
MGAETAPLVDCVIEDARWEAVGLASLAEAAARAALEAAGWSAEGCEIALLAADDARLAALNAAFRGKAAPTNVLAFPAAGDDREEGERAGPCHLGDIAIAYETCAAEAAAAGIPLADHATHLVVHGVLHLLGHAHEAEDEAERMEALETKTLASLGVADPYSR